MRAAVISVPGGPEVLELRRVPVPEPKPGWVLIRVHAFGLNRSEQHFRKGLGSFGTFPRIPGLEAVGVVEDAPGGEFAAGTQVAALMGGMGREYDGGYAEYTCVPVAQVVPFVSDLPWAVLGAVPEMLQTAYGSLRTLGATPGQTLLIRGGTSSIGLALAVLARREGLRVLSTTRRPEAAERLREVGVDEVVIDDGSIADAVRALTDDGADAAVELVGTNVLRDTLGAVRYGGTVCFTGMLSDEWSIPDFYPMDWLPNGVRLTAHSGGAADLTPSTLQTFLDAVAADHVRVPVGRTYDLSQIVQAHRDLDAGTIGGKGVVVTAAAHTDAVTHELAELPAGATLQSVTAGATQLEDRRALRVELTDAVTFDGRPGVDYIDQPTFVLIPADFTYGTLQVDLRSGLNGKGPSDARAFAGLAYRITDDGRHFESIYLRPLNGLKTEPSPPRDRRAVQYFSYPDWPFDRLRETYPDGRYEAGADIGPDEWTRLVLDIDPYGVTATVNGVEVLRVQEAKAPARAGRNVGLFVDIGTEAFFSGLVITPRD